MEDFDSRWEDVSTKMDQAVKDREPVVSPSSFMSIFKGCDDPYWASRKNSSELIELSSI